MVTLSDAFRKLKYGDKPTVFVIQLSVVIVRMQLLFRTSFCQVLLYYVCGTSLT